MGMEGSIFVVYVLFQGAADLLHPHLLHVFLQACIHTRMGRVVTQTGTELKQQRCAWQPYIHILTYNKVSTFLFVLHLTLKRGFLFFRDNMYRKSRKQKPVSCEIAAAPPWFVVLQASLFHPLRMGFLWNLLERNIWFNFSDNLYLAVAQIDSYWVMSMIMKPCPCHTQALWWCRILNTVSTHIWFITTYGHQINTR